MKIDIQKLLDQEPEFKEFAKEAILRGLIVGSGGRAFLLEIYAFYEMGLTPEQVGQWVRAVTSHGKQD